VISHSISRTTIELPEAISKIRSGSRFFFVSTCEEKFRPGRHTTTTTFELHIFSPTNGSTEPDVLVALGPGLRHDDLPDVRHTPALWDRFCALTKDDLRHDHDAMSFARAEFKVGMEAWLTGQSLVVDMDGSVRFALGQLSAYAPLEQLEPIFEFVRSEQDAA